MFFSLGGVVAITVMDFPGVYYLEN